MHLRGENFASPPKLQPGLGLSWGEVRTPAPPPIARTREVVGEEQVQRLPLLRIPARPGWVSSFTGRGDGGLALLTRPCWGGGKCVSSPGSRPASGNAAQGSVTNPGRQGGGQAARAPRGSQVTCEEAWLGAGRLHRGAG